MRAHTDGSTSLRNHPFIGITIRLPAAVLADRVTVPLAHKTGFADRRYGNAGQVGGALVIRIVPTREALKATGAWLTVLRFERVISRPAAADAEERMTLAVET